MNQKFWQKINYEFIGFIIGFLIVWIFGIVILHLVIQAIL